MLVHKSELLENVVSLIALLLRAQVFYPETKKPSDARFFNTIQYNTIATK
jgi:hypothetical protein